MITLLFTAFLVFGTLFAKSQTVQFSPHFDEPEALGSKVFQSQNGNTLFFTFTKRSGIELVVYDTARRVKVRKTIEAKCWEKGSRTGSEVKAIYEIRGQVVLFAQHLVSKKPLLYRMIIDPENGRLVKEDLIGSMDKYGMGARYALAFGTDPKTFHVVKDQLSDCYAVVRFDGFASSDENRIEVVHYNGAHEEINRLEYTLPPGEDYKYIRYLGMSVDSNRAIFIATYAFDTRSSGGKDSKVIFAKLKTGDKAFQYRPLDITEDFKETTSALAYNAERNTLDLLLLTEVDRKTKGTFFGNSSTTTVYYSTLHMSLDAATMTMLFARPLTYDKISEYKAGVSKSKKGFSGLPQNMIINSDFTTTITFEEMSSQTYVSRRGSTSTTYTMGDIGVLDLNKRGEETEAYVMRKSHAIGFQIKPFAQHDRGKNHMLFDARRGFGSWASSAFYSFDLVSTAQARYVIYNDNPVNFSKRTTDDIHHIGPVSGSHAVCQRLSNGNAEKFLLFDNYKNSTKRHFIAIGSSHFLPSESTYAAMVIEKIGKTKKARIAWVKFP